MIEDAFTPEPVIIDRIEYDKYEGFFYLYQNGDLIARVGQNSEWARNRIGAIRELFSKTGEMPSRRFASPHFRMDVYTLKGVEGG